ncbi:MAG: hypothetical protein E7E98_08495 [Cutibacterium avidum]|nr:hypothetical protein [Cutibacterium avidum]
MPTNDTGTTMQPTSLRERIDTVLQGAGLSPRPDEFDSSIHSWRCKYPDRYGRCTCLAELVDDLVRAVTDDGTSARPTEREIQVGDLVAHRLHPELDYRRVIARGTDWVWLDFQTCQLDAGQTPTRLPLSNYVVVR